VSKHGVQANQVDRQTARLLNDFDFDDNPEPMWVFDVRTFAFLAVNQAAIQHYGYSRQQFLAMTTLDIRPSEDVIQLLRKELHQGKHHADRERWRHRKRDGNLIDVEITSREISFNGILAEIVMAHDATRKDASSPLPEKRPPVGHWPLLTRASRWLAQG